MKNRWVAYLIPLIPIVYGILSINGIKVPRIQLEDGYSWLWFGLLLYPLALFGHIQAIRREKKLKATKDDEIQKSIPATESLFTQEDKAVKLQEKFCKGTAYLFIGHLVLYYSNFPYVNDFTFILISGLMAYCGYELLKKIKNKKDAGMSDDQ